MPRFSKIKSKLVATRARAQLRGGVADNLLSTLIRVVLGVFENIPVLLALAAGVGLAMLVKDPGSVLWKLVEKITDTKLKNFVKEHLVIVADWALMWYGCMSAPPSYRSSAFALTLAACYVHSDTKVSFVCLAIGLLLRFVFVSKGVAKRLVMFVLLAAAVYVWWEGLAPVFSDRKKRDTSKWLLPMGNFTGPDGRIREHYWNVTDGTWCRLNEPNVCFKPMRYTER